MQIFITNRFMIHTEQFVRDKFGAESWENVLSAMPHETSILYRTTLNPKGATEFDHIQQVLEAVEKVLVETSPTVLYDLGLWNSEHDLTSTQRLLMKLISVSWVLKTAAVLWKQRVKNGGTIHISTLGKGHVKAEVRNFSKPSSQWWSYLAGWFACAITFSGGDKASVRWTGGGERSSKPALFDARWF